MSSRIGPIGPCSLSKEQLSMKHGGRACGRLGIFGSDIIHARFSLFEQSSEDFLRSGLFDQVQPSLFSILSRKKCLLALKII